MDTVKFDGLSEKDTEQRSVSRGRGRRVWNPNSSAMNDPRCQGLRRPHNSATDSQSSGGSDSQSSDYNASALDDSTIEIAKKSTLSAEAKEFVPRNSNSSSAAWNRPSVQSRLQHARELPGSTDHHQQHNQWYNSSNSMSSYQQHYQSGQGYHRYDSNRHHYHGGYEQKSRSRVDNTDMDLKSALKHVERAIYTLTMNPGQYEDLVTMMLDVIRPHYDKMHDLQQILNIIIQQSINECNFRYSGARLCKCLESDATDNQFPLLLETLTTLCNHKMQSLSEMWKQDGERNDVEQKQCHGFILFLAELIVQMNDPLSSYLGDLLIRLITNVLQKPARDSVKNICQALKLSGRTLEKDKRACREEMENMMRSLTKLVTEGRVDSHIGRMVNSVNELRNGNWGRGVSTNSTVSHNNEDKIKIEEPTVDEPIYYGPDGHELSAEENEFLQNVSLTGTTEKDTETETQVAILEQLALECHDEDEDDMIASAYEEFLKMTNK